MTPWHIRKSERVSLHDGDIRTPYQRDKARIMHAASFRRLQAKTQVVGVGISDFYRTRLTHSLEAAQIGTGIVAHLKSVKAQLSAQLGLDEYLIETICLGHDIGHPPFGHGGEVALHYMMSDFGGFEGNGQTFRILTNLESYSASDGMNLARRSLLGILKYPNFIDVLDRKRQYPEKKTKFSTVNTAHWIPPKGLFYCDKTTFDWVLSPLSAQDKEKFTSVLAHDCDRLKTQYKSVDCSIMELADDIAYAVHDLEDAVVMSLIDQMAYHKEVTMPLRELAIPWLSDNALRIEEQLFCGKTFPRKNAIGGLVNAFITAIDMHALNKFDELLLDINAYLPSQYAIALNTLKQFVFRHVIRKPEIQILEYKGQQMIMAMFEVFANEPQRLLPENTARRWHDAPSTAMEMRIIADYISGMTDEYANRVYANLFLPKSHRITDR
ncbi:anti-phage deoxyguanosine triphosphatase [Agaribacter flavus]|uniref:Deoxyguanosinetriphosphate triphosphohydrolase-like protein n=1 Tax=Agaribacter flavus TaxID=1902781 RepID=A0ABV7FND8_9ALTE